SNNTAARPESVTISLLADGNAAKDADGKNVAALVLNSGNNWNGAFENLPETTADGTKISYTVSEAEVEGYTSSVTALSPVKDGDKELAYAFSVENTAESGQLTVRKRVSGSVGTNVDYTFVIMDEAGTQVDSITIRGEGSETITVPAGVYTVTETNAGNSTVARYMMRTSGSGQRIRVQAGSEATATIVNTYTPENEDPPPTTTVTRNDPGRPAAPPPVTTEPQPERAPQPAQPPIEAGQVLGVRQTDSEQVLGARRGKTGDRSTDGRLMTMVASGAAALLALLTGRRKRKLEDDDE
ncbi:MAG: Cna B-type domain-containing protein, partial [Oscillospiraceae bacterium]|nr:Cna B-type domain-containing protein [Oscillospiraceae bacterium]